MFRDACLGSDASGTSAHGAPYDWAVVIFGMNELGTILSCLASAERNAQGRRVHVTVVLNGSTDGSAEALRKHDPRGIDLRIHEIAKADKANAINQYIHALRPPARKYFFMDAYVELQPAALLALAEALDERPDATVASGLPLNGRSAGWYRQVLLRGGAINGNIYAVRSIFLDRLKAEGLRLPLHIYRTDPLLASMAAHNLDAIANPWDSGRMIGVEEAGYTFKSLSLYNWRDLRRQWRREIKQTRGLLESAAIKSIIYRANYRALPADANDMLRKWIRDMPPRPQRAKDWLFLPLALRQLRRASS